MKDLIKLIKELKSYGFLPDKSTLVEAFENGYKKMARSVSKRKYL